MKWDVTTEPACRHQKDNKGLWTTVHTKFDNLEEMNQFLGKHKLPQHILYKIDNLNSPITIKRDTKGTFHAKMSSIKDRNGMDLTEAEHIKKRWQEYTEELYKKDLHDPDNHDGVITDLEPDILEC